MASESSASPGDDAGATGSPPRPPPPSNVSAEVTGGRTDVDCGAAPLVQDDNLRHGMTAASIRALDDDDPPLPLLHIVDHKKESEGTQLHDGPPAPPELDESLAKNLENDIERQLPYYGGASTVQSTVSPNAVDAAAVGPPMVEGVEEVNVSSRGSTPSTRSHVEAVTATAHVGLDSPSSGRPTIIVEAYRVEEAEVTPGIGTVHAEVAVIPCYQRKGFVSVMIAVTLFAIGVAATTGVLFSNNMSGNTVPGQGGQLNAQSSSSMKTPTSSPNSNVSRKKKSEGGKDCQPYSLGRLTGSSLTTSVHKHSD